MKVLSFGAGAIGGYLGISMARQGHAVTLLERPYNIEKLQENGIRLQLGSENFNERSFTFTSSISEALSNGPFDIAIFALKSYNTQETLKSLVKHKENLPPFLCLQNGVDNELALAEVLGKNKVIAGTVTTSIGKNDLGDLVLERKRGIGIGADHPISARIVKAFNAADLNAKLYANSASMKWSKLLTNLLSNAQSAIYDKNPAQILNNRISFAIEIAQIREALAVMRAMRLKVVNLPGTPVRALAFAAKFLPIAISQGFILKAAGAGRGGKMPSLHIDLHGGKSKSEVEWLNGAVVKWGKKHGVATPVNHKLLNDLLQIVNSDKVKELI